MEGFVRSRLIWMAEGCERSIELFVSVGWCCLEGLFDPIVGGGARCLPLRCFGAFVVVFVGSSLRCLLLGARLRLQSLKDFVHTCGDFGFSAHSLRGGLLALIVDRFVRFALRGDFAVSQAWIPEPGSREDEVGIFCEALRTGGERHVVPFGSCAMCCAVCVWRLAMECYAGAQESWVALEPERLSESEPWGTSGARLRPCLGRRSS